MVSPTVDTSKIAHCTYELNGQTTSLLHCSNNESYEAFSGREGFVNDPSEISNAKFGPLPPGRYYILDRESGGMLGWIRDHSRIFMRELIVVAGCHFTEMMDALMIKQPSMAQQEQISEYILSALWAGAKGVSP